MRRFDKNSISRLCAGVLFLAGLTACDSPTATPGPTPPPPPVTAPVAFVEIIAPAGELTVGQAVALGVRLLSAEGAELSRPVAWTSSDTAIARVSVSGVVTGVAPGTADITARSGDVDAMVSVTIRPPAGVAAVEIEGPLADLEVGQAFLMTVRVRAEDGALLYRPVTWTSTDTAVLTVSSVGVLTARATGRATVTAAVDGRQAAVQVSVRAGPPASISELLPARVRAGSPAFEMTIRGTGFQPGARVQWAGQDRAARVISPTEIRLDITAADIAHVGAAEVLVQNPGQTLTNRLYFIIEGTPVTHVYDLKDVAWIEAPLPFEVAVIHIGGNITRAASQRVLAGVLRIHEPGYGPSTWDLTITMETVLLSSGEVVKREDLVFFGNVEHEGPYARMRLRSGMFYDVVLETLPQPNGDLLVLQSLHPSGDASHEKAWRYRKR